MTLKKEDKKNLLKSMLKIRKFELLADKLIKSGNIFGTTHLYVGEEAIASGVCYALKKDDYITSTHRGHGHCIAKSDNLKRILAELLGKEDGFCNGKGGSMHIASFSDGILGANGIVGGSIGIATGAAFAVKKLGGKKVVACFFGEGATNQGLLYESLNLAKIWNLPIIYICENNLYAISVHIRYSSGSEIISNRLKGFGIKTKIIDGNNVEEVYYTIRNVAGFCRKGEGPFFIECLTYRQLGHSRSDNQPYRTKDEVDEWKKKDPIDNYINKLINNKVIDKNELERMMREVDDDLDEALKYANNSKYPDISKLYEGLYYNNV